MQFPPSSLLVRVTLCRLVTPVWELHADLGWGGSVGAEGGGVGGMSGVWFGVRRGCVCGCIGGVSGVWLGSAWEFLGPRWD